MTLASNGCIVKNIRIDGLKKAGEKENRETRQSQYSNIPTISEVD